MTIAIIDGTAPVSKRVIEQLRTTTSTEIVAVIRPEATIPSDWDDQITVVRGELTVEATYTAPVTSATDFFSGMEGLNVDLVFEALFDALYHQRTVIKRFVMLSTAGVDEEVTGHRQYAGITDIDEYLKQQRYAAKIVDENEAPYTILRPVTLVDGAAEEALLLTEGQPVPAGTVSRETVALVGAQLLIQGGHDYQSLAIVAKP